MAAKITREALENFLHCKYKARLILAGEQGNKCDYERLLDESRQEVRRLAVEKILARHPNREVARDVPLNAATLRQGPPFILDATLNDDAFSVRFDGLKKVEGASQLGDFHYIPVLFHEGRQVGTAHRHLLEALALLLSRVQGRSPGHGVVYHGRESKAGKTRLDPDPRKAEQVLRELRDMATGEASPKLLLNEHCQICQFRQRCQSQAVQEDNLSLLRGMGEKELKAYSRKGILTLTQLAHTFRPRRKGKRQVKKSHHRYHALHALAIRDKRIYIFGTPELRDGTTRVYLDMEGDPEAGYVYLIGMIVADGGEEKSHSFWADSKEQEVDIFEQLLAELGKYDTFLAFSYGGYERTFLKRMKKAAPEKEPVDRLLDALVNALSVVYGHFYFPCYSNGLKDVGAYLGCSWSEPDASGIQSVVWRRRWEATRDEGWKRRLLTYNLEDCLALKKVTEAVYAAVAGSQPGNPVPDGGGVPPVARVQEIDKWANDRKWGRVNFVHPEFKEINNRAYFDYQRERVYARTGRTPKTARRLKKGQRLHLRVSRRVTVVASKCPSCSSSEVLSGLKKGEAGFPTPRCKIAFDLVLTPGGIKRRVIECRSSIHKCLKCQHAFVPEEHQRLSRHFRGLKSWAMYQHVAHRLSLNAVQVMLREFFGLRVHSSEILQMKSLMAQEYQATYSNLLAKLLAGGLLHIDETEMKLQTGKGYVWVLSNLEEVVLMYKPTREGDFLKDLLKDFKGVLVSDFYSAYDSLDCPQQKCLVHLMRDMNQELLNNPFDQELRSVTGPFGTLLRQIVATVDEHGLKRRYLQRHKQGVDCYFKCLAEQSFRSEAAEALRARLLKYRGKLFTFIEHDGVPWNNNNAENAIKQFAYYREEAKGIVTEPGLCNHLVLLSVYQTCRYKGVSFLKFLASGQLDVDAFRERKRARPGQFTLEVYPEGFLPCRTATRQKETLARDAEKPASETQQQAEGERTEQPPAEAEGQ
jgi:predicted RecB family nuclease